MKKVSPQRKGAFPIVGIGASAGGLEAFLQFLSKTPTDTGMAFIFIQHLDPTHASMSVEILSRATPLDIEEVKDGTRVKPNRVYVIPPNHNMSIENDILSLSDRSTSAQNLPIDLFLRSLAKAKQERSIGVVLSGTGSDGTQGLLAIKSEGGVTYAQDPKSAKYNGMPQNAISSGAVDLALRPEEIAKELVRLAKHPYLSPKKIKPVQQKAPKSIEASLRKIFSLVRSRTKVDFTDYKQNTINRRIQRRMMVHKFKTLPAYVEYLLAHEEEIQALYNDFLINVTDFFRDPEEYDVLVSRVFPAILKNRDTGAPIRIWVPGCATGEEAYSIAISLIEFLDKVERHNPVQIFATDISELALQKARAGLYPDDITKRISAKQLSQFFDKVSSGYKIRKSVRDLCLFSRHDVTCDPPFAKLDLISCRNVLIYFAAALQKRVIPSFHYALNPGGFLWLGKAENPGEFSKLFNAIDKTHKIYSKSNTPTPFTFRLPNRILHEFPESKPRLQVAPVVATDFKKDADKLILTKFAPPAVIINGDLEILQFRGRTFPFLEPATGRPSLNLFKMIHPQLLPPVRRVVQTIKKENKPVVVKGLQFEADGQHKAVNIEILPLTRLAHAKERTFLVVFKETENIKFATKKTGSKTLRDQKDKEISELSRELTDLKEYQHSLIEQYEAAQDELTAANEELQSTNEEFLSTNEETETAKEELQSTNEELVTVNDELQARNAELMTLSGDLNNLLASIDIPVLMVSSDHRIRLFSPKAKSAFNLIPGDVGRPVSDIKPNFNLNLDVLISEVAEELTPKEVEIQDNKGLWLRLQIRPYKTIDNKIDGAIIALIDIDALKQKELRTREAFDYITAVADTVSLPLAVVNQALKIQSVNRSFNNFFQTAGNIVEQDLATSITTNQESIEKLLFLVAKTVNEDKPFSNLEINCEIPKVGSRKLLVSGGKIHWIGSEAVLALLSFSDVTEQRKLERERSRLLIGEQEARAQADKANRAKDVFLATLSHELRTPLASILTWAQLIREAKVDANTVLQGAEVIERSAKTQSQLIDDLLDISRITSGKLIMKMKSVDPAEVIEAAVESVSSMAKEKSINIAVSVDKSEMRIHSDPTRLQQIIWNLLTNAIKFSPKSSVIDVSLKLVEEEDQSLAQISVTDHGTGIPQDFLPHIFSRFSQADSASTRIHGGLGLGLSIVKSLVSLHNGTVTAENNKVGPGAVFTVTIPALPETKRDIKASEKSQNVNLEATARPNLEGLRVLLIDDDESARESMGAFLKLFGAEVATGESAAEGLMLLQSFEPDVLVSDIAMPGEDGYSLIKKIRAQRNSHAKVPALALTAYATSEDIRSILDAGFQSHLAKPIDANVLGYGILEIVKKKVN